MERTVRLLKYGWRFQKYPAGTAPDAALQPGFDDSGWDTVRVPHDWAISGEFEITNDCTYNRVTADGIFDGIDHTGRTGGLPHVGDGIYRIWIDIPAGSDAVALEFDGVMWESHVYVNGTQVYFNHFGYKSFETDLTPYVKPGEKALIAVKAEVFPDCSRWYPGGGIFRNVRLVTKSAAHIRYHGVWMRQLTVTPEKAAFELSVDHTADSSASLHAEIVSPSGETVCVSDHGDCYGELSAMIEIPAPELWSIAAPRLYTVRVELRDAEGQATDEETVRFGIRTVEFTPDKGFFLNGEHVKLNGVCNHHDLGSIGAAVNVAALRRQLRLMKEMGVNAIRTSHNPPSPELLELCDEMGFCVMDEMFDEWYTPKIANGYAKYFREHAAQDAVDIIRRDRNHPSVVLWSIGNEIGEQKDPEGWRAAKLLSETCHRTDPTRKTTAGFDNPWGAFDNHLADYVDVVGINYKPHKYAEFHEAHPGMCFVGTETESCISTRGVYHLPAEIGIPVRKHDDLTVSAYDLEAPPWAYFPEREWAAQDDCEFMAGCFVWTGMDYLGEPTPYYTEWPSRSSYFGVVDLAGLPKNRFYGYRARWTENKVLHVFPHWNWPGMEGKNVPVHAYCSWPSAELFINGVSFGVRTFDKADEVGRFRLVWNNAVYTPGEVRVVAYDENGTAAAEAVVRTAGQPHHLELAADRESIAADGDDLVYFTAAVADKDGNICPLASDRLFFTAEGEGELLTTDSGDQRETEPFVRHDKKALAGYCVACVRSVKDRPGTVRLRVTAKGLEGAEMEVPVVG